jgi:hypothetical protein
MCWVKFWANFSPTHQVTLAGMDWKGIFMARYLVSNIQPEYKLRPESSPKRKGFFGSSDQGANPTYDRQLQRQRCKKITKRQIG